MAENASSSSTMSLASLATPVPETPMAMPTSAFLRAGASLMPSPVTATTSPAALRSLTTRIFTTGVERAMTAMPGSSRESSASSMCWISRASTARLPESSMPSSRAIAVAVTRLSPVSILSSTPARRHSCTASKTSGRSGSEMQTKPSKAMLCSADSCVAWAASSKRLCAKASTR